MMIFLIHVIEMSGKCRAVRISTTAPSRLPLRLSRIGKEFFPTMFAAKIKCLSVAVGVDRGGFVNGHPTDGIFGSGYCIVHDDLVFLGCLLFSRFPTACAAGFCHSQILFRLKEVLGVKGAVFNDAGTMVLVSSLVTI